MRENRKHGSEERSPQQWEPPIFGISGNLNIQIEDNRLKLQGLLVKTRSSELMFLRACEVIRHAAKLEPTESRGPLSGPERQSVSLAQAIPRK